MDKFKEMLISLFKLSFALFGAGIIAALGLEFIPRSWLAMIGTIVWVIIAFALWVYLLNKLKIPILNKPTPQDPA